MDMLGVRQGQVLIPTVPASSNQAGGRGEPRTRSDIGDEHRSVGSILHSYRSNFLANDGSTNFRDNGARAHCETGDSLGFEC